MHPRTKRLHSVRPSDETMICETNMGCRMPVAMLSNMAACSKRELKQLVNMKYQLIVPISARIGHALGKSV